MLTYEPSQRISAKTAVTHTYFANIEVCVPPMLWVLCDVFTGWVVWSWWVVWCSWSGVTESVIKRWSATVNSD